MKNKYVACDLGAESGRVILGTLENNHLHLEEIHRFANGPTRVLGSLRWNVLGIFAELKKGLAMIGARQETPRSLSVDSWGVDYVYIRRDVPQLGIPYHYRDARTDKSFHDALARVKKEEVFENTGIQFMSLNTLYQLFDDLTSQPEVVRVAEKFLCIADYLNFLFSGREVQERSLASTTQLYDTKHGVWSKKLIKAFGLKESLFPELIDSGKVIGAILPDVAVECGLPLDMVVAAVPTHDTASAVVGVPAEGDDWAFLSSGTWSLLGLELPAPIINKESFEANFTNEIGHGNSVRFLKNIIGLWILQECRRSWVADGRDLTYDEITAAAAEAPPFRSLINPGDSCFLKPGDMPARIQEYCRQTGQPLPGSVGEFARCIMESLALLYGETLQQASALANKTVTKLHVVGGGSKNALLNQLTANACGIEVIAGPVEATAAGNLLIQAVACGDLKSLADVRMVIRNSFPVEHYQPASDPKWESAKKNFAKLIAG